MKSNTRSGSKPFILLLDPLLPKVVSLELSGKVDYRVLRTPPPLLPPPPLRNKTTGLVCLLSHKIDKAYLDYFPKLKAIATYSVGTNHIDLTECARRKISVVNTPDVLTTSTAELALLLTLSVARRLPEGESLCRNNRFNGWSPTLLLGKELDRKTAVLIGEGRIGKKTAQLFKSLGMRCLFIRRTDSKAMVFKKLNQADVLSIHTPLTPETTHWLDAEKLSWLPRRAIVINTARGPIIDEAALIRALRTRQIFGAGLDVFENEPKIPAALRRLSNVVLLPHLGSATCEAREAMVRLALSGLISQVLQSWPDGPKTQKSRAKKTKRRTKPTRSKAQGPKNAKY